MTSPLRSLIACGTKIWLDSIDPELVAKNRALGATGATSNPIIIADLIKSKIAKLGENISVARFVRFKVGDVAAAEAGHENPAE